MTTDTAQRSGQARSAHAALPGTSLSSRECTARRRPAQALAAAPRRRRPSPGAGNAGRALRRPRRRAAARGPQLPGPICRSSIGAGTGERVATERERGHRLQAVPGRAAAAHPRDPRAHGGPGRRRLRVRVLADADVRGLRHAALRAPARRHRPARRLAATATRLDQELPAAERGDDHRRARARQARRVRSSPSPRGRAVLGQRHRRARRTSSPARAIGNTLTISVTSPDPRGGGGGGQRSTPRSSSPTASRRTAPASPRRRTSSPRSWRTSRPRPSRHRRTSSSSAERLRDLEILSATATGNFELAIPATAPSAPYAPQPTRSAIMAGALGLPPRRRLRGRCARSSTRGCAATARSAR